MASQLHKNFPAMQKLADKALWLMQFTSLLILHGVLQEWICISMHFQFASSLIMIYVHKEFPQFSRQIEGVKWIYLFLSFDNLTIWRDFLQFSREIESVN